DFRHVLRALPVRKPSAPNFDLARVRHHAQQRYQRFIFYRTNRSLPLGIKPSVLGHAPLPLPTGNFPPPTKRGQGRVVMCAGGCRGGESQPPARVPKSRWWNWFHGPFGRAQRQPPPALKPYPCSLVPPAMRRV